MADGEGFEPPAPCDATIFKTVAFDHSATHPLVDLFLFQFQKFFTSHIGAQRIGYGYSAIRLLIVF